MYSWAIGNEFAGIAPSAIKKMVPSSEKIGVRGSEALTKLSLRLRSRLYVVNGNNLKCL